jgi:Vacuolar sorting protein 9 (VPS9) domain
MQHAMSAMTEDKPPNEDAQNSETAVTATSDSLEKSDDDTNSTEDKVDDDESGDAPPPASQNAAVDTKPTPESADMARNVSETSSEINLQFPPTQSKRPRREDDQYIRSAGADVLLPLLIYTVVKSNPQKFVSNLKFIQRYRMSSKLIGEASYCLTNMVCSCSWVDLLRDFS